MQIQSLRRANRPAGRAITRVERSQNLIGLPSAGAHALERADKAAHLIVQKTLRTYVKPKLGAMGQFYLLNIQ